MGADNVAAVQRRLYGQKQPLTVRVGSASLIGYLQVGRTDIQKIGKSFIGI